VISDKMASWKQGIYKPINEKKYIKPVDKLMNSEIYPTYRSSWELKFLKFCDLNQDVIEWSSEPFAIKYLGLDNKIHRYYIDFMINIKGKIYLIEIKPYQQAYNPKNPVFKLNQVKWKYAREFCRKNGFEFKVLTEKELF